LVNILGVLGVYSGKRGGCIGVISPHELEVLTVKGDESQDIREDSLGYRSIVLATQVVLEESLERQEIPLAVGKQGVPGGEPREFDLLIQRIPAD